MAGDWFFLSYARLDRDEDPFESVRKFYSDLDREIRLKKKISEGTAGFYDGTGIQQGDQWPQTLGAALNACRAMVCLYSPTYFDSEYCGKEFEVFNSRLDAYMNGVSQGTPRPKLIIPVLLHAPEDLEPIPEGLADTQYHDDAYPEVYRREGLRYFFRRTNSELQDRYQDFLDVLVNKLLAATAATYPPPLPVLPDIKTIKSAFHTPRVSATGAFVSQAQSGPRYADFFYVAGKSDEIQPLGRSVDNYGLEGELDWKPYLPEMPDEVGLIAQSAATKEGFRYQRLALNDNLLTFIKDAESNNRIVILLVDAWTLRLQKYKQWMLDYDRMKLGNCAVLIVWNDRDTDTARDRQLLDFAVRQAFVFKARIKDPHTFINNIRCATDLTNILSITLQKVRAQIIETNDLRRIETQEVIAKPEISGPGATVI